VKPKASDEEESRRDKLDRKRDDPLLVVCWQSFANAVLLGIVSDTLRAWEPEGLR
jgi:hypothetical protein